MAMVPFAIYGTTSLIRDINSRFGLFGDDRRRTLYEKDAKAIFWEGLFASYHDKSIRLFASCINDRKIRTLEDGALEFGKAHHPELTTHICIMEDNILHIFYREGGIILYRADEHPIVEEE